MSTVAAPADRIKLLVVDDWQATADALARRARKEIEVKRWVSRADRAPALAADLEVDAVTMDLGGVGDPWGPTREIAVDLRIPVLIVTGGSIVSYADQALACGASGILEKKGSSSDQVAALRQIVRTGKRFWDERWKGRVDDLLSGKAVSEAILSETDIKTLRAVLTMKLSTYGQAAQVLEVDAKTVARRMRSLRERFNAVNDADLLLEVHRSGWVGEGFLD